ncbi:UNVERIFIED_CONTAM: hypothetical protein HDU68_004936 [Siphonaria sp. JEL0065]|nr:hypothetical protein HDU68_004936 [Siphonaria sp. JEL0065]
MRQKTVDNFRARKEVFTKLAQVESLSLDDLCRKFAQDKEFGEECCVVSFCDFYAVEVTVYTRFSTGDYTKTVYMPHKVSENWSKISLHLDLDTTHYEVVLDKDSHFTSTPGTTNLLNNIISEDDGDDDEEEDGDCTDEEDVEPTVSKVRRRFQDMTDPNAVYLSKLCTDVRAGKYDAQFKNGQIDIHPPDAVNSLKTAVKNGKEFSPKYFLLLKLSVWNPYLTCPNVRIHCPRCKASDSRQSGYSDSPRRIYCSDGSLKYMLSARGLCGTCSHKFRISNAYTISKLGFHHQDKFNAILTKRAGLEDSIIFDLRNGLYQGLGPTGVHSLLRQRSTSQHSLKERAYYATVEELLHELQVQPTATSKKVTDSVREIPLFPTFKFSEYDGGYPSVKYLSAVFVKDNGRRRDWLDFEVQRRDGKVLCIDHYFKICKHLAPINGHKLFKALFTGKNEYREIRLQALTQTAGHADLVPLFRSHELTRKFLGYAAVELVYTDKCCSDRTFLQSMLEQITPENAPISLLPLPHDPLSIRLLSTDHPKEIETALARVVQHIRALPDGKMLPIGLDCEWNVGPNGKDGKVRLLQLAIKERLLSDTVKTELILLIVLKDNTAWPGYLKEVVESTRTLKIGSRIVAADFKYLHEDFGLRVRSLASSDVCDLAHFCKQKGKVEKANMSLANCCAEVLHHCLDKDEKVRRSNWSTLRLSKAQKEYAARDAWASLLIYLALEGYPDNVFSNTLTQQTVPADSPSIANLPNVNPAADPSHISPASSADSLFLKLLDFEDGVRVLQDSIHCMMRLDLSKKHPMFGAFFKALRDAIFIIDEEDKIQLDDFLRRKQNTTFEEELLRNPDWVLKRCRRYIPLSDELYRRVKEVLVEFSKDSYKDLKGVPLLSDTVKKDMRTLLNDHIKKGCLSDPEGVALYTQVGKDKDGLPLYATYRGTSDIESLHQLLEQIFSSMNCSSEFMDAAISQIRHVFNIRASERHRPGFPKIGHYEHYLIDHINEITHRIYGKPVHKWWTVTSLFRATSETFGVVPLLPEEDWDVVSDEAVKNYPLSYRFLAKRTRSLVPYLPVHTATEWRMFTRNLSFFVGGNKDDGVAKSGRINFKEMASRWNAGTLPLDPIAPVVSQELVVCKKFESHFEDAYKVSAPFQV